MALSDPEMRLLQLKFVQILITHIAASSLFQSASGATENLNSNIPEYLLPLAKKDQNCLILGSNSWHAINTLFIMGFRGDNLFMGKLGSLQYKHAPTNQDLATFNQGQ